MLRSFAVLALAGTLSACALATIPLNIAAQNALSGNVQKRANEIPGMNCRQLRQRWSQLNQPAQLANPTRQINAEKQLVRDFSRRRGCPIG